MIVLAKLYTQIARAGPRNRLMYYRTKIPDTADSPDLGAAEGEKVPKSDLGGSRDPVTSTNVPVG